MCIQSDILTEQSSHSNLQRHCMTVLVSVLLLNTCNAKLFFSDGSLAYWACRKASNRSAATYVRIWYLAGISCCSAHLVNYFALLLAWAIHATQVQYGPDAIPLHVMSAAATQLSADMGLNVRSPQVLKAAVTDTNLQALVTSVSVDRIFVPICPSRKDPQLQSCSPRSTHQHAGIGLHVWEETGLCNLPEKL